MQIWVDADACPRPAKEILFRASNRTGVTITLVANQFMATPPSPLIRFVQVPAGFDVADNEIVKRMKPGDLVITADIPLAAEVVKEGGHCISPRGELFTEETIGQRLAIRDFLTDLRDQGVETGGPSAFGPKERTAFANQLDRFLPQHTA